MQISDWIAIFSFILSSIAAIWAYTADIKSRKNTRRLQELELAKYKQLETERKKALIDVSTAKIGSHWEMIFRNTGLATAKNIRVWAQFMEDKEHKDGIIPFPSDKLLPYPFLHSGGNFRVKLMLFEGHNYTPIVKITWDDDSGNDNEREVVVNL